MQQSLIRCLAVLLLSGLAGPALATVITYTATLSGAQEVPANGSAGSGTSTIMLDTNTQMLSISVSFSGLVANVTAAHIHCCAPSGVNAGVAVSLMNGFPLATSGVYNNTFDLNLANVISGSFVTANGGTIALAQTALLNGLNSGYAYVNLHTSQFPGGEIRGQYAVSEPGMLGLLLLGIAALRSRKPLA